MRIKSSERGVIRVFHIDLPKEAIERFTTQAGTGEWPLHYALGAKDLRPAFVEVINIRDLGDMTLSEYLVNAHDVSGKDFDAMRQQLDSLRGFALVLPSQAFNQTEQELTIAAPLRWIGTFNEPKPASRGAPVRSESAKGTGSGQKAPPPAGGGSAFWFVIGAIGVLVSSIILAKLLI
ncbi:aspartate carbamoyltransferase catalytic subunit [Marivita hallyeonensis]|nr:aspartate carbamoyltransferase catalytic subunit [Marivita hallyeonensis]